MYWLSIMVKDHFRLSQINTYLSDWLLSTMQLICCSICLDDSLILFLKGQDAAASVATVLDTS